MASHPFESAREATLAALIRCANADPRIEALWLQGSLAAGGADPFTSRAGLGGHPFRRRAGAQLGPVSCPG
jgi:hypothetical protein